MFLKMLVLLSDDFCVVVLTMTVQFHQIKD